MRQWNVLGLLDYKWLVSPVKETIVIENRKGEDKKMLHSWRNYDTSKKSEVKKIKMNEGDSLKQIIFYQI